MSESETFTPEAFIQAARWRDPKDPASLEHPHQYVLRGREAPAEWHDLIIRHIEEHGYRATFKRRTYTYLDLDGHTYWVSPGFYGGPDAPPIINRRRNDG